MYGGGGAVSYLIVAAGGVEGVGAAGEKRLVITRHQHFDVVVTFVLSGGEGGGNSLMLFYIGERVHVGSWHAQHTIKARFVAGRHYTHTLCILHHYHNPQADSCGFSVAQFRPEELQCMVPMTTVAATLLSFTVTKPNNAATEATGLN